MNTIENENANARVAGKIVNSCKLLRSPLSAELEVMQY